MNKLLILLIILIIATIIYKFRFRKEPFTAFSPINIAFCPFKTTNFIDKNGNSMCCDGDVDFPNRKCLDKVLCTLSSTDSQPSCSKIYTEYIKKQETTFCNSKYPNYFETDKMKGCTNALVSNDRTKIETENPKICKIYNTDKENITNPGSCSLYKYIDNMKCTKYKNCKKDAIFDLVPVSYDTDKFKKDQVISPLKAKEYSCVDLKYAKDLLKQSGESDSKIETSIKNYSTYFNFC
jgi:hypothetical protein